MPVRPARCYALLAALVLAAPPGLAPAQDFPTRPVTLVVPYAPGATDREARSLAEFASRRLGQPVVVENKEGAGGAIGTQFVARARADGHTLLYAAPAVITIAPLLGNAPYRYEDLVAVARTTTSPHVLGARADAPFRTVAELVAHARATPGKVTFGSSGNGTAVHLAMEALADAAQLRLNHVPFRGLAPAITAALGGHIDLVIGLPSAIMPQVKAGKLASLAQFGATRNPAIADVPTLKESGVAVDLAVDIGLFAPAGTPAPAIARIGEAFAAAVGSQDFRDYAARVQATPAYLGAESYARLVDTERAVYAKIVPSLKLGDKPQ